MFEHYGFYALALGVVLVGVSYFWALGRAFRTRWWWGLLCLLFPPAIRIFAIRHRARGPISLFVLGFILAGGAYAANLYGQAFLDLGPRERIVDGERHLTLTGWDPSLSWWDRWRSGKDRLDYSLIRDRPNLVVLQMANEDVNDGALANLLGQDHLRELDLNGAHITDEGLPFLSQLPELQELSLAQTAITDEGPDSIRFPNCRRSACWPTTTAIV